MLSVTPRLILDEFRRRGYDAGVVDSLAPGSFLYFVDHGGKTHFIRGVKTAKTNAIAISIADDKLATATLAERLDIPHPQVVVYQSDEQATTFLRQYGRIVVKPLDGSHGNGVTVNIETETQLRHAIQSAAVFSKTILLQRQVEGRDVRLLYIDGRFCAATERQPASIVGDGVHTISELVLIANSHPDRGLNYEKKYNVIPYDVAQEFIGEPFETSVPAKGEVVRVIGPANIGSGGVAVDVTDEIAPEIIVYGERLLTALDMGIAGVDFMIDSNEAFLIEFNGSPSFGLHHFPHEGKPRDVTSAFIDWITK